MSVTTSHLSAKPMELADFPTHLHKHIDPRAPIPLRDMGAKGLAPGLSPGDLALILFQLQFDPQDHLKTTASKTFADLPTELAVPISNADLPAPVLDFCARRWLTKRGDLVENLIRNSAIDDSTVAAVASRCSDRLAEIISENQVRLLRSPIIIEKLYHNANAHQSVLDRIIEFAVREKVEPTGLPGLKQAMAAVGKDKPGAKKLGDDGFAKILKSSVVEAEEESKKGTTAEQIDARVSEFKDLLEDALQEGEDTSLDLDELADEASRTAEEEPQEEKRFVSRQVAIQNMNIAQKVRLASIGSRADRALLVRDPNRLIHMAAIVSPKIQYGDIKDFAGNKDLPNNVINYIAGKKEAIRDYTLLLKLVNNPKLSIATGIRMLNHMRNNDLRSLSRSRNVNPSLAKSAKNLHKKRTRSG